jgi:hypothetical protein
MDTGEGRFEMFDIDHDQIKELFGNDEPQINELSNKIEQLETVIEKRKQYPNSKGIFTVGEELEIRGSSFIIKDISPWGMKLKLLPALKCDEKTT